MTDNARGGTGRVDGLSIHVQPERLLSGVGVDVSVLANQWLYFAIDVPLDATKLTVFLSAISARLNLYIKRDQLPSATDYDKFALIDPPGGSLSIGLGDVPPLNAGRYFIGVFNPNAVTVDFHIAATIDENPAMVLGQAYLPTNSAGLPDDAITDASLVVTNNRSVADVQVGVRIDHARASDLVLHLVSPQGTRILLAENRGSFSPLGYGISYTVTNVYPQTSSGGPEEDRKVIETKQNTGTIKLSYDFFQIPDTLHVYYDGVLIFDTGLTNGTGSVSIKYGPGSSTQVTIVVNEGGSSNPGTAWNYTAAIVTEQIIYTFFTENTNLTTTPIKFG